jgi:hypothetical protein
MMTHQSEGAEKSQGNGFIARVETEEEIPVLAEQKGGSGGQGRKKNKGGTANAALDRHLDSWALHLAWWFGCHFLAREGCFILGEEGTHNTVHINIRRTHWERNGGKEWVRQVLIEVD